jgi:ornithine cyclodeaminase/alanine dehydrogenase-like protein (mu-crystallin family)
MTLIINNQEVQQLLTMEDTIGALEQGYLQLAAGEAVCRPRIDIRIPTSDPARNYQLPGRYTVLGLAVRGRAGNSLRSRQSGPGLLHGARTANSSNDWGWSS